jgi:hypothetical protein
MPAMVIHHDTIGSLSREHTLVADCPDCRRSVSFRPWVLASKYGAGLSLSALKERLRCSRCGSHPRELRLIHSGRPSR